jgi:hypothetical protein
MKKYIDIPCDSLVRLEAGERLEGSICKDRKTGRLVLTIWNRRYPKNPNYRLICHLPDGSLLESEHNIIFRNRVMKGTSVKDFAKLLRKNVKYAVGALLVHNRNK